MIKLFASDLDGTLLNEQHKMDERILSGIRQLQQEGYITATATGRSLNYLEPDQFPGMYFVAMNGAMILDPQLNILASTPIQPEYVREIYEKFGSMPLEFNSLENVYTPVDAETFMAINMKKRGPGSGLIPVKDPAQFQAMREYNVSLDKILSEPIYKINCIQTDNEVQDALEEYLRKHTDGLINCQSMPSLYEITDAHANKADGVRLLGKILGIAEDETAVFGDGGNDLLMLEAFENSFAPVSGTKLARKAASTIIGPNKDYSVIDTMLEIAQEQENPKNQE